MTAAEELKARRALASIVGTARAQLDRAPFDGQLDLLQRSADLLYALQRIEEVACAAMPHLCPEALARVTPYVVPAQRGA